MNIEIDQLPKKLQNSYSLPLTFGEEFSDHMFTQRFDSTNEWKGARISKFENFSLSPAASVLHYGQEIFEGLKAYKCNDGSINLFRPLDNLKRFNYSAKKMSMPIVDEKFHFEALKSLVSTDSNWVPSQDGASLYIRPAMIATGEKIGLQASSEYLHFIISGPVGPYFNEGMKPVGVYVSETERRAVVGGVGDAKTGGNYAASLRVSEAAAAEGFSQVLWLDAIEGKYVEEVGAMNIFFVHESGTLFTPRLTGSILAGITRDSVLKLAPTLGYTVCEGKISIEDVLQGIASGSITEVFGCGTAAVIAPIGELSFRNQRYVVSKKEAGPVSRRIYEKLTNIQYGIEEASFDWVTKIEV